jgi:hypothetical protein
MHIRQAIRHGLSLDDHGVIAFIWFQDFAGISNKRST